MYWFYPAKRRPGPSPAGVLFGVRRLIEYARRLRPEGAPRRTPMSPSAGSAAWPELPYAAWKDTCATLQLWTQVVGKICLTLTPWLNHSWHITLHVTARGLPARLRGTVLAGAVARARGVLRFRTAFLGKASPVHFFWGSFDLAVTRFSGRRAPPHPGGVPHLPDTVAREAYSHEVSSAGFWPGGGPIDYAAFYSYAYPAPDGFAATPVRPAQAHFSKELGEFILPYDAVRTAADPRQTLMDFLQSTYAAAADNGKWNRAELECALGEPARPRFVSAA